MLKSITVIACFLLASCANVLRVHESESGQASEAKGIPGIPFYVKKEQFRKTTVYADTWLRAILTVEKKLVDTASGKEVLIESGQHCTRLS